MLLTFNAGQLSAILVAMATDRSPEEAELDAHDEAYYEMEYGREPDIIVAEAVGDAVTFTEFALWALERIPESDLPLGLKDVLDRLQGTRNSLQHELEEQIEGFGAPLWLSPPEIPEHGPFTLDWQDFVAMLEREYIHVAGVQRAIDLAENEERQVSVRADAAKPYAHDEIDLSDEAKQIL